MDGNLYFLKEYENRQGKEYLFYATYGQEISVYARNEEEAYDLALDARDPSQADFLELEEEQ